MGDFDAIVVGAGPAGEVCAGRLGENGLSVAIVEHHLVGGECSFYACMPSKALLRPAEALDEARRIPGAAEAATGRLDVDGTPHTARRAIVIATGSEPAVPPIPGLAEAHGWTNREGTTSHTVPERLLILGGGVVGVELGQAWSSLGSHVAIVEAGARILAREEELASRYVHEALTGRGVDIHTGSPAVAVERNGAVRLTLDDGTTLEGDEILVAVGRRPATRELGLETVGLEPGKSVDVDEHLRSRDHDWLYAIGDANGRVLLTHMGKYQGRIAADTILGRDASLGPRSDGPLSPRVIFTEPQVAAVGHTLESAEQAGIAARAVDVETSGTAGGSFYGRDTAGTSRIVVDTERGVVVGATFCGVDVGEWLHAATIAVVAEVPLETLWHAVPSFPTRSEVWLRLLETYGL